MLSAPKYNLITYSISTSLIQKEEKKDKKKAPFWASGVYFTLLFTLLSFSHSFHSISLSYGQQSHIPAR